VGTKEGRDGGEGRCTRVSRKERQVFAKVAEVFKIGLGDHSNAGPKSSALIVDSTSCRIVLSGAGRRTGCFQRPASPWSPKRAHTSLFANLSLRTQVFCEEFFHGLVERKTIFFVVEAVSLIFLHHIFDFDPPFSQSFNDLI
jgi:hypothetical protein